MSRTHTMLNTHFPASLLQNYCCCAVDYAQQVLQNSSYAEAAAGVSHALQQYASRRQPYKRAADAIEVALVSDKMGRCCGRLQQQEQPEQQHRQQQQGTHADDTKVVDGALPKRTAPVDEQDKTEL